MDPCSVSMASMMNLYKNDFSGKPPLVSVTPSELSSVDSSGRFSDMRREEDRLKTFDKWPLPFMQPEDLARNGFYYLGRGDEVCCAFCRVEIMRWEEGDDPAKDHLRWAPHCPLVRGNSFAGNVPINVAVSPLAAVGHKDCDVRSPVHPKYASEAARLHTFKDWPKSMKSMRPTPKELAEAGFYYIGQSDKTKCFHCDVGLNDWEKDDVPWEQHAKWFGSCAYVQLVKGKDYVQKVQEVASVLHEVPEEKERTNVFKPETGVPASPKSRLCYFLLLLLSNTLSISDLEIWQIMISQGARFLNWILILMYSGISSLLSLLFRSRCLTQEDWRRLTFKVYILRALVILSSYASGKQSGNGEWHLSFPRCNLSLLKIFFIGIL